jgi:hypothetical protein
MDNAPYLAALVASSCSAKEKDSAERGEMAISGPCKRNRPLSPACGSIAVLMTDSISTPAKPFPIRMSWARDMATRRVDSLPRASDIVALSLNVWSAIACTVASIFLTR